MGKKARPLFDTLYTESIFKAKSLDTIQNEGILDRAAASAAKTVAGAKHIGQSVGNIASGKGNGLWNDLKQTNQVSNTAKYKKFIDKFIGKAEKELVAFKKDLAPQLIDNPGIKTEYDTIVAELDALISGLTHISNGATPAAEPATADVADPATATAEPVAAVQAADTDAETAASPVWDAEAYNNVSAALSANEPVSKKDLDSLKGSGMKTRDVIAFTDENEDTAYLPLSALIRRTRNVENYSRKRENEIMFERYMNGR